MGKILYGQGDMPNFEKIWHRYRQIIHTYEYMHIHRVCVCMCTHTHKQPPPPQKNPNERYIDKAIPNHLGYRHKQIHY